jgi:hypothetical protein
VTAGSSLTSAAMSGCGLLMLGGAMRWLVAGTKEKREKAGRFLVRIFVLVIGILLLYGMASQGRSA